MPDQYAEAREVVEYAKADARQAMYQMALMVTREDAERIERALATAYVSGYSACARSVTELAGKIGRGAGVGEVPAAYDAGFRLDESNNATASPPPEGQLVLRPDAIEVLRAVRPSREAVAFLVGLTREALAEGKTDDACGTLALALCMRALARG